MVTDVVGDMVTDVVTDVVTDGVTDAVTDVGDYDDPARHPRGVIHVVVGGQAVIRDGEPTGARPGQVFFPERDYSPPN